MSDLNRRPIGPTGAAYAMAHPEVCTWERVPLAVDTGGGAAWGTALFSDRGHFEIAARVRHQDRGARVGVVGVELFDGHRLRLVLDDQRLQLAAASLL